MSPRQPVQNPTLINSLQSEVATEASPLLEFLARHAKSIMAFFLLCIIGIGAYWIYSSRSEQSKNEEIGRLGRILILKSAEERFAALQKYVTTAPGETRAEALFALAQVAQETNRYKDAEAAWGQIATLDKSLEVVGKMGQASALMSDGKKADALKLLEDLLPAVVKDDFAVMVVNEQILSIAESMGNYKRAIVACEALVSHPSEASDPVMWRQKLISLQQKTTAGGSR